jgi:hypothetical protein
MSSANLKSPYFEEDFLFEEYEENMGTTLEVAESFSTTIGIRK